MAQPTLTTSLLLLLSIICMVSTTTSAGNHHSKAHVLTACRPTRYPALCVRCLSGFPNITTQNPEQLAQVALAVSLYKARRTRSYMVQVAKELQEVKGFEYPAVTDCLQQIESSISLLSESIHELRRMGASKAENEEDAAFRVSNVETWVSSALTEASTCAGQFPGRRMAKVKATIKGKVVNVAQTTSNALALFHRYAMRYRAANKP